MSYFNQDPQVTIRVSSPVKEDSLLSQIISPNTTILTISNISPRRTLLKEKQFLKEKLNLNTLPSEVLQYIAAMLDYNDIHNMTRTFRSANIIRKLPLSLYNIQLTIEDIFHYFNHPDWNITELNINLKFEEKFQLPNNIYNTMLKLRLGGSNCVPTSIDDVINLKRCINLHTFIINNTIIDHVSPILNWLNPNLTSLAITINKFEIQHTFHPYDLLFNFSLLQHLSLNNSFIPNLDFMQFIPKLISLNLFNAVYLNNIQGLKYCPNLTSLDFLTCRRLIQPIGWDYVSKIEVLHLDLLVVEYDFYPDLSLYPKIKELNFIGLTSLAWMPRIESLSKLTINSSTLPNLRDIDKFPNLRELTLEKSSLSLDGIQETKNIEILELINCEDLDNISVLAEIRNIQKIKIWNCGKLENITAISNYLHLKELSISNCTGLDEIPFFTSLTNLTLLDLKSLENYNFLSRCSSLVFLVISLNASRAYTFYNSINECHLLEKLEIFNGKDSNFPKLPNLTNLKHLILHNYEYLLALPWLDCFPNLRKLTLDNLRNFGKLENFQTLIELGDCPKLEELKIKNCSSLISLGSMSKFSNINTLIIRKCYNLKKFGNAELYTNLNTLIIEKCPDLTDYSSIQLLAKRLNRVHISYTRIFTEKSSFEKDFSGWKICLLPGRFVGGERMQSDLVTYGLYFE